MGKSQKSLKLVTFFTNNLSSKISKRSFRVVIIFPSRGKRLPRAYSGPTCVRDDTAKASAFPG